MRWARHYTDRQVVQSQALLAGIARLVSEETSLERTLSRAAILLQLMDGRAHPAAELAAVAGVKPSTASAHLRCLCEVGLVTVTPHGRRRLHTLANAEVANAIEALAAVSPPRLPRSLQSARVGDQLVIARTCYGHLAGRVGVAIAQRLVDDNLVAHLEPGEAGTVRTLDHRLLRTLDITQIPRGSSPPVRACLDWSQRVPHLAGALGRAILTALLERQWLRRRDRSRALTVTPTGLRCLLDLDIAW